MPSSSFAKLTSPNSPRKLAEWVDGEVEFSGHDCPIFPEHSCNGERAGDLSVALPGREVDDFVWTWYSECLVQDHVLDLFRKKRFTGFKTKPVKAKFKRADGAKPPRLQELVVTGWGGMAEPQSGIKRLSFCPHCKSVQYRTWTNPDALMNEAQWDGSDFFMIWPMPKYIFITSRVVQAIEEAKLTGYRLVGISNLYASSGTLTPGPLSEWMPERLAHERGKACGIEEI